jgi:hypothetical protein
MSERLTGNQQTEGVLPEAINGQRRDGASKATILVRQSTVRVCQWTGGELSKAMDRKSTVRSNRWTD